MTTGLSSVLLGGDEAVDLDGTQEDDSRYFLEGLQFFLKKPVV